MRKLQDKLNEQKAVAAERKEATEADMMLIARHFNNAQGKKVLNLLLRRGGVLQSRFQFAPGAEPNALRAARRDGAADIPLFIVECMKLSGATEITLPL